MCKNYFSVGNKSVVIGLKMRQLHLESSGRRSAALILCTETKALEEVSQGYRVCSNISRKNQLHENVVV